MDAQNILGANPGPHASPHAAEAKVVVENFSASFGPVASLRNITLTVHPCERLAIIGPASSGKTTFLRSLNRLNDLEPAFRHTGRILLDGTDIYDRDADTPALRRRLGMVYATPTPLPWSIYENIVFGPRTAGVTGRRRLEDIVERALRGAFLWEEVKDRLKMSATDLSGGQQQRLCLARVLALEPELLLLDEPCSGLDPISTAKIEDAMAELKARYSIVLVTNNTKQAARASDRTAFFLMGELIEIGPTRQVFTNPVHGRTNDYITGNFG
ncbi:MAG: phosphate ABC transporter ATP-binding protein [Phycisphaerae bacterium]|jgi:phosphate transport system ATP-binding protein